MRTAKDFRFRYWNVNEKSMNYVDLTFMHTPWINNEPVMQFTGFQDVDGEDIFEGDIYQHVVLSDKKILPEKFIVEYISCYFDGKSTIDGHCGWLSTGPYITSRVIGNIYENPELL